MENINPILLAYDPQFLPFISDDTRFSASSYDREGGNKDYNNWLYEDENGEKVLLDVYGPGCIYKFFIPTAGTELGWLKFYIDEAKAPTIEGTFEQIFSGNHPFFDKSLVNIGVPKNSAFCSYLPIPFAKHIKITSDCPMTPLFYYHIDYRIFPPETEIESWTSETIKTPEMKEMTNLFSNCGKTSNYENIYKSGKKTIENFSLSSDFSPTKITTITANSLQKITLLRLKIDGISNNSKTNENFKNLKDIILNITFDNASSPQISSPMSGIFAFSDYGIDKNSGSSPNGFYRAKSLVSGIDEEDMLYLTLQMPFEQSAEIEIVNKSEKIYENCVVETVVSQFDATKCYGKLHIKRTVIETAAEDKNDINLLNCEGSGCLVGITATMDSDCITEHSNYLEGDEHIYVDFARSPQINGTGTEDFYNGAYFWYDGTETLPMYGCSYNAKWSYGRILCTDDKTHKTAAYRFLLGDSVPFGEKIVFDMEHGSINESYEYCAATLFYYQTDKKTAQESDKIDFSSNESLTNHTFKETNLRITQLVCTSRFEGLCTSIPETKNGKIFRKGADFSVKLSVNKNNKSVILRKTFEYSFINQKAEIFVDGKFAGYFYDAGQNTSMRFRDSEIILPPSLTKNKDEITVRFNVLSESFAIFELKAISKI